MAKCKSPIIYLTVLAILVSSIGGCGPATATTPPKAIATNLPPVTAQPSQFSLTKVIRAGTLERSAEQQIWQQAPNNLKQNPFVPEAFKQEPDNEEKQQRIAEFYEFLDVRDKVIRGIASQTESEFYYSTYIRILQQRMDLLDHLLSTLSSGQNTNSVRIDNLKAEKKLTEALLAKYRELATAPQLGNASGNMQRHRVICADISLGMVFCIKESDLASMYLSGHWTADGQWITDAFNVSQAYEVLIRLDQIGLAFFGDITNLRNTLVGCGNGEWFGIDTTGSAAISVPGNPTANTNLPSPTEIGGIRAGCGLLAANSGNGSGRPSGGGTGPLGESRTSDAVDALTGAVDAMMGKCRDDITGGVSFAPIVIAGGAGGLTINIMVGLGTSALVTWAAYQLTVGQERRDQRQAAAEAGVEAYLAQAEADGLARALEEANKDVQKAQDEVDKAQKDADVAIAKTDSTPEEVAAAIANLEATKLKLDQAKATAEIRKQQAEGAQKRADDKKNDANKKKEKAGMTSASGPGGGGPDTPLSTCKDMKSRWDRFKAECNRTQSWDRPGTACNALLRRANGCVNVRQIVPSPDDTTLSCSMLSVDEATLWQEACKDRQSVASSAEPGAFGCGMINKDFVRNNPGSICGDPAAIVTEDQCLNLPNVVQPGPITQGNPPRPVANVWQWGNIIIVDGLGLDGLGFGLPGNP